MSCSIEISDKYIYMYVAVRQVVCSCLVVRTVGGGGGGGLSVSHFLKHNSHFK